MRWWSKPASRSGARPCVFDPARGKALTWLLGMAHSRAIDAIRHERRFEHDSLDVETLALTPDAAPAADAQLAPLLDEAFARAWAQDPPNAASAAGLRQRLLGRLQGSRLAQAQMFTTRRQHLPRVALAPGVSAQTLHQCQPPGPATPALRPGRPAGR